MLIFAIIAEYIIQIIGLVCILILVITIMITVHNIPNLYSHMNLVFNVHS